MCEGTSAHLPPLSLRPGPWWIPSRCRPGKLAPAPPPRFGRPHPAPPCAGQGPGGRPQFGVLCGACGVRVPGWQRRGRLGETRQLWVMPLHVLPPAVREGSLGWARALLRGHFTQPPVSSQSSPARCAWWQRWGEGDGAPKVPGYQAKPRGTCSCQPAAPHLMGPESWEHRRREVSTQVRQASPAAKVAGAGGPRSS